MEATLRDNPHYKDFILYLADTSLILAQRLCEWCGHGPILEQDIALSNTALDLLGQATNYYTYAAELSGGDATADSLAMLRLESEYKNLLLVELPNGDFGRTVARQFFFSSFQELLQTQLLRSGDLRLGGIAEKALKETRYHLRWSAEWMIRLGDGTDESHRRMQEAVDYLLPFLGEFFLPAPYEKALFESGLIPDSIGLQAQWAKNVEEVLLEATLEADLSNCQVQKGGKQGVHTEYMGYILAELQFMQRTYPGLEW